MNIHLINMRMKHIQMMIELEEEIKNATGYRKKDLKRKYEKMQYDLDEFDKYCREEKQ